MKKLTFVALCILVMACNSDDARGTNCNFLFDAGVNLQVNTNLPQFNQLLLPFNGVYVPAQGNSGVWLWRATSETLLAWDAADPSEPPSACSTLDFVSGDIVQSGCANGNRYSLSTGIGLEGNTSDCTLKPYRVDDLGGGIFLVTN